MLNKLSLVLLLSCATTAAMAEWPAILGAPEQNFIGTHIAIDHDGNVVVAGAYFSEITIAKYTSSGDLLWTRNYKGLTKEGAHVFGMSIDAANSIIISGDSYHYKRPNLYRHWTVLKLKKGGSTAWVRSVEDEGDYYQSYAGRNVIGADGSIYVFGGRERAPVPGQTMLAIRYSSSGEEIWRKAIEDGQVTGATGVALDNVGNAIVAATGHLSDAGSGYRSSLFKLAKDTGNALWTREIVGSQPSNQVLALALDSQDNPIISVLSKKLFWLIGEKFDVDIQSYSSDGDLRWINPVIRHRYQFIPTNIAVDSQDNAFVAGNWFKPNIVPCIGYRLMKLNTAGQTVWSRDFSNFNNGRPQVCKGLELDSEDNAYVTGYAENNSGFNVMVTAKFSKSGKRNWVQLYGETENAASEARAIAFDRTSGAAFVTGKTAGASNSQMLTTRY